MKIMIDAGHGGTDSGAVGIGGVYEKNFNLDYALFLATCLKRNYIHNGKPLEIVFTRTTDVFVTLAERSRLANSQACDVFISLHNNAYSTESANGFEIYCYGAGYGGESLAKSINAEIKKLGYYTDRGVKYRSDLAVLNSTNMPAILIENGFITNTKDCNTVKTQRNNITYAFCRGIAADLGLTWIPETPVTPTPTVEERLSSLEARVTTLEGKH